MVELVIVRHAEAVGQGRYLGRQSDPVLTEKGLAQAEGLAELLLEEYALDNPDTLLFSSPLRRAVQTAYFIKGSKSRLKLIPDLAEIDFGLWDGLSRQEICSADEALYRQWITDPIGVSPPGGETMSAFRDRVENAFIKLQKMYFHDDSDTDRAIIFTHGGVVRILLCILLGIPIEKFWSFSIDCARYSAVRIYHGGFTVLDKHNTP